ncbi:hypothetical protein PU629_05035 [Pullulanibacillus sp. KACC 23026]|nr:hypothetical protein [Pullulanibacillus sp. KACC 23026]WEG13732.1 hypothetical protein PU629_05035 [Pullulanibacillus sp. KACC 23026]
MGDRTADKKRKGRQGDTRQEEPLYKIKSTVISPPEPTPHPKDYESIDY